MAKYTNLRSLFTAIADAIRSKTGETSAIVADNFPDAIRAIATHEDEDAIVDGSIASYSNDRVTMIRPYAFAFNTRLKTIECANLLVVRHAAFMECTELKTVRLPSAGTIHDNVFAECIYLTDVYIPNVNSITNNAFVGCTRLKKLDARIEIGIGANAFSVSGLETLIIRSDSSVPSLGIDAFYNSPIDIGDGYIYVPRTLVEQYKVAQNWSTYASKIRAIEDYPEICGESAT